MSELNQNIQKQVSSARSRSRNSTKQSKIPKTRKSNRKYDFKERDLEPHYNISQKAAAKKLGCSWSTLKRRCADLHIKWPFHKNKHKLSVKKKYKNGISVYNPSDQLDEYLIASRSTTATEHCLELSGVSSMEVIYSVDDECSGNMGSRSLVPTNIDDALVVHQNISNHRKRQQIVKNSQIDDDLACTQKFQIQPCVGVSDGWQRSKLSDSRRRYSNRRRYYSNVSSVPYSHRGLLIPQTSGTSYNANINCMDYSLHSENDTVGHAQVEFQNVNENPSRYILPNDTSLVCISTNRMRSYPGVFHAVCLPQELHNFHFPCILHSKSNNGCAQSSFYADKPASAYATPNTPKHIVTPAVDSYSLHSPARANSTLLNMDTYHHKFYKNAFNRTYSKQGQLGANKKNRICSSRQTLRSSVSRRLHVNEDVAHFNTCNNPDANQCYKDEGSGCEVSEALKEFKYLPQMVAKCNDFTK